MDNYGENNVNYGAPMGEQPAMEERVNNLSGVAKIKVIGVGGAGNNAVNRLVESGLTGAEYIVVNTDNQTLLRAKTSNRIQIGIKLTKGLGAGADPSVGKAAAEENKDKIQEALKDTDLLFITAGMGGGTGTGAAPVIAKIAKDMKILTVAVVTLPFSFEAKRRMDNAVAGVEELSKYVDSIITIPNDKIRQVVPEGTSFPDALKVADDVLRQGIRGIAELIVKPSLINLDFADVKTTLKGRGVAHMGIGVAKGEKRISDAVRCAVCSPLLNTTIEGASSVILNVVGGKDLSLDEVWVAADLVRGVIDYSANVIFGACIDETMSDEVEVVIIATGFANTDTPVYAPNASAAQRASALSERITRTYNETQGIRQEPEQPQPVQQPTQQPAQNTGYQPIPPYNYNPNGYTPNAYQGNGTGQDSNRAYGVPTQDPSYGYPQAAGDRTGNVGYQEPQEFEPNDPIPETPAQTEKPRREPGFVRFFMGRKKKK